MPADDGPPLSDRQARAVIIAAERLGFEREPDLYVPWYDHDLHEDAEEAARYLRSHDPNALDEALVAEEPIAADVAAHRISESSGFTMWHAEHVIGAAAERGFIPPASESGVLSFHATWDQARASVAFLWQHHPSDLAEALGELAQIAPLPETARRPGWDAGY